MNGFILQTAKDYDMAYDMVKVFYDIYGVGASFYDALERHIEDRSNK